MSYIIQKGDTLSKIANQFGTTVDDLLKLNPTIKNKNLIYTGNELNLPDDSAKNRTLEGTLPSASDQQSNPQTMSQDFNQAVPQTQTYENGPSIANFKAVLTNVTRTAAPNPSVSDVIARYADQGVKLTNPNAVEKAYSTYSSMKAMTVGDIYRSTMDLVNEQEQRRQEQIKLNNDWAHQLIAQMPSSVFGMMDSKEFEAIKNGYVPDSLFPKIADAYKQENAKYQFVLGNENTPPGVFDQNTGTFTNLSDNQPTIDSSFVTKYTDGTIGGQCGTFTRKIIPDVPLMGNTIQTKQQMIDQYGILAQDWKNSPQVGDVLIMSTRLPEGHAAVVNKVDNQNRTITLTESNWNGDEKVTNTRTISFDDPSIYGAYRSQKSLTYETGQDGKYSDNVEFTYNQKIDTNMLPDLGGSKITDKTARDSNLPFGITTEQANWIMEHRPGNIEFQRLKPKDYDSISGLFELKDDLAQITALADVVNTGPISSRFQQTERFFGKDTQAFNLLELKTGKELAEYIKSISGAAVSEQEAQRLAKNIPNVYMSDSQFRDALSDYSDDLEALIDSKLTQYDFRDAEELRNAVLSNGAGEITEQNYSPNDLILKDGKLYIKLSNNTYMEYKQ